MDAIYLNAEGHKDDTEYSNAVIVYAGGRDEVFIRFYRMSPDRTNEARAVMLSAIALSRGAATDLVKFLNESLLEKPENENA